MVARFASVAPAQDHYALVVIQVMLKAHGAENTKDVPFMFVTRNLAANFDQNICKKVTLLIADQDHALR